MRNGHRAEAQWRYGVLTASHPHDLSLDFLNSNGDPDRKREEFSVPFLDRVAQVTIDGELTAHELPELIQSTRSKLVQVLQQKNRLKGRMQQRYINIDLYLAVFDSWCEGLTRTEAGKRHGVSQERASQISRSLLKLKVIQRFVQLLKLQLQPR